MAIQHINYKSDFSVILTLPNGIPTWEWAMTFRAGGVTQTIKCPAGRLPANVHRLDDKRVEVFFDNHGFQCGRLFCEFSESKPDSNYADGEKNTYTPQALPIELWPQASDDSSPVSADVYGSLATALESKVDKVTGKGLSSNDYTDEDKAKLEKSPDLITLGEDFKGITEEDFQDYYDESSKTLIRYRDITLDKDSYIAIAPTNTKCIGGICEGAYLDFVKSGGSALASVGEDISVVVSPKLTSGKTYAIFFVAQDDVNQYERIVFYQASVIGGATAAAITNTALSNLSIDIANTADKIDESKTYYQAFGFGFPVDQLPTEPDSTHTDQADAIEGINWDDFDLDVAFRSGSVYVEFFNGHFKIIYRDSNKDEYVATNGKTIVHMQHKGSNKFILYKEATATFVVGKSLSEVATASCPVNMFELPAVGDVIQFTDCSAVISSVSGDNMTNGKITCAPVTTNDGIFAVSVKTTQYEWVTQAIVTASMILPFEALNTTLNELSNPVIAINLNTTDLTSTYQDINIEGDVRVGKYLHFNDGYEYLITTYAPEHTDNTIMVQSLADATKVEAHYEAGSYWLHNNNGTWQIKIKGLDQAIEGTL